jgi:hypothetical protein
MGNVRLPSDNLTPAQLKQRNGRVETYNLRGPMQWEELLSVPLDLRKKYLERLRDEYKATGTMLMGMLGACESTFRRKCKEWGVKFQKTGGHLSEHDRLRWLHFLEGTETLEENEAEPVPLPEHTQVAGQGPVPTSGRMTFVGPAAAALQKAYEVLGATDCTLTITWETEV